MIESLLRNYYIKNSIAIGFVILVLFSSIINSYINYYYNKNILYTNIDNRLENTALNTNMFLDDSFYDRAILKGAISDSEDMQNILTLSKFVNNLEIEYLYTMVKKDNKIYFTSSSATNSEINTSNMTRYYDEYEEATDLLLDVIKNGKKVYEESSDKWGTFRTIFIPLKTKKGNDYIIGADIKIDFINQKLDDFIRDIITTQVFIILILLILGFYFIKISRRELNEIMIIKNRLDEEIKEKTDELAKLNHSLENRVNEEVEKNREKDKQMIQQSKMASMGEMIGAIAHQWRQPLNIISMSIQNLKYDYKEDKLEDEEYIKEFIEQNKKTIGFMSRTIDDFRNFFRVDKEKKEFDIFNSTQGVIDMILGELKSYNIDTTLSGDNFEFIGFESEYQQVVLNIINNAKDALLENEIQNPKISIIIDKYSITIEDNAGGVPKNIIDRIFEPYFTTKEQGKGTGIGLYMSKMIIEENMGGSLSVKNSDNGAIFKIEVNV